MNFGPGHQSEACGELWCQFLHEHYLDQWLMARRRVFDRWPSHSTATRLHEAAGAAWPEHHDHVLNRLVERPSDAILFALSSLKDPQLGWDLAQQLALSDYRTWDELLKAYQKIDSVAVLPMHARLVNEDLREAKPRGYKTAARRLVTMRRLAIGAHRDDDIDSLIAQLREQHRNRPRLLQEFDRAGLP